MWTPLEDVGVSTKSGQLHRIVLALEQHDEIIGVAHQFGGTTESRPDVPDEPLVEHFVQVDVREER